MRDQIVQGMDRLTGDDNAWWHERNYVQYVDRFRAAVLISHGLNDLNTKPRMFARLWDALTTHNVPRKIWLNTGGHGDGANSGSRQAAWRDMLNRFWSHTLYGIDNAALDGPKAAVQRSGSVWADYDDWPVPGAAPTTINLAPSANHTISGLQLASTRIGQPVMEVIVDNSAVDATVLAAAAQSPHRLIYRTEPLSSPVHISGIPSVSLRMSFNEPAAIVSAMLVEYRANGTRAIITRGWADPQNRKSLSETFAIHPGTPTRSLATPAMDLQLAGKVAMVAGASRGLGFAVAHALAAEGCAISMVARDETAICDAARRLDVHVVGSEGVRHRRHTTGGRRAHPKRVVTAARPRSLRRLI